MYRVIVVDDEEIIRRGIVQLADWQAMGCVVVGECVHAREALAFVKDNPVDIVVTDIRMPVMDGLALVKTLSEQYPDILSVILTSYSDFDYAQKALRYGAADFLIKNEFITELPQAMARVIARLEDRRRVRAEAQRAQMQATARQSQTKAVLLEQMLLGDGAVLTQDEKQGFGWIDRSFCAVACELTGMTQPSVADHTGPSICAYLQSVLPGWDIHALTAAPTLLVFLFGAKTAETERVTAALLSFLTVSDQFLPWTLLFGVGDLVNDITQVGDSCRRAREALFGIVSAECRIATYSQTLIEHVSAKNLSAEANDIGALIREGESEAVLAALFAFAQSAAVSVWPPETIRQCFLRACMPMFATWPSAEQDISHAQAEFVRKAGASASLFSLYALCRGTLQAWADASADRPDRRHYLVEAVDNHLREHYCDPLTLLDISRALHVSPSHISRLYKSKTGHSITSTINRLRVTRAKTLLRESTYRIYEVARMVGFDDPGYFALVFTKFAGCSPSEYREQ